MAPSQLKGCHLGCVIHQRHPQIHDVHFIRHGEDTIDVFVDNFSVVGDLFHDFLEHLHGVL